ncbi:MAG: molybdopterin-dependent oxidoreductase, partial [Syntrophales bacterium]|nr:molybdopterin-dependent oxidoreductase [Syntrophales bacterium]
DMGQGNATAFFQIAGAVLNQESTSLEVIQPDTDQSLPSGSAAASRTTYTYGNALIRACEELKKRILGWAALILLADTLTDLELLPGRVRRISTGREIGLRDIGATMPDEVRVCIHQFIMPVVHDPPETGKEFFIGFPHLISACGAHVAQVEVDELTGAVAVKAYAAATDGGAVLNPPVYEQQIQGAIAQGLGYALTEELRLREGYIANPDFTTYVIPSALDIPELESIAVATYEPSGPFGMKGIGEVALNGPLPAVAAAVADAVGIRISDAPLTAERVLLAWEETKKETGREA